MLSPIFPLALSIPAIWCRAPTLSGTKTPTAMVVIVDFDDEELDRFHGHEARHILDLKAPIPNRISDAPPYQPAAERRVFRSVVTEAFAQYP